MTIFELDKSQTPPPHVVHVLYDTAFLSGGQVSGISQMTHAMCKGVVPSKHATHRHVSLLSRREPGTKTPSPTPINLAAGGSSPLFRVN